MWGMAKFFLSKMLSSALIKLDLFEEVRIFLIKSSLVKCQKANNTSFEKKKRLNSTANYDWSNWIGHDQYY